MLSPCILLLISLWECRSSVHKLFLSVIMKASWVCPCMSKSIECFTRIISQECGPFETKGMVLDRSFDVYIRDFGVVKRVYCEVCVHRIFWLSLGPFLESKTLLLTKTPLAFYDDIQRRYCILWGYMEKLAFCGYTFDVGLYCTDCMGRSLWQA